MQARDIVICTAVYAVVYFTFLDKLYGILQMFTFLTIPILSNYNGKRGTWKGMKCFFYIYCPAHLVVIGIIRLALHGNVSIIFRAMKSINKLQYVEIKKLNTISEFLTIA